MKPALPILMLCAGLIVAMGSGAMEPVDGLLARLHQPAVLRGSFTQSRQISGFKNPVVSGGEFVVARGQGLLWHTTQPFESLLSVSPDRLRVSNGKGGDETVLDARREPMLRSLNDILQSVVIADVAALRAHFEMNIRLVGASGWELTLKPKEAALLTRFAQITLTGGENVETVLLAEASGDVTSLRFRDQQEDTQLTADEAGKLQ